MIFKPRARLFLRAPLDSPSSTPSQEVVEWEPRIIRLKWTKNSHLAADELTVSIPWRDGGFDPRIIKHARCGMYFWDDQNETFDPNEHLRFIGVCKKAGRKLASEGWEVELTFHDYTSFFLMMKPFPSDGIPEWSDTLPQAWAKICDYTGYRDTETNKIVSNVSMLRDRIVFDPPELQSKTIGEMVTARFHKVSKPTPRARTDAWAVWQYCCQAIGLVSYIDRDRVIVTTTNERFKEEDAPLLLYGEHILEFHEHSDTHVVRKGILGKAFDPLTFKLLESAYPDPSDPFIKKSRAAAKRASEGGPDVALNETSAEYEEFNFPEITDQKTLDAKVRQMWEEFSKQEMKGRIRTRKMWLPIKEAPFREVSPLDLSAGDCIYVGMDEKTRDAIRHLESEQEKVEALTRTGFPPAMARLIARNIGKKALALPVFHVETIELEFSDKTFNIDITYHNKVYI